MLAGTFYFALLTGETQRLGVGASLGLADELECEPAGIVAAGDAPVGDIITDDLREADAVAVRKFEVEDDLGVSLEAGLEEVFLDVRL